MNQVAEETERAGLFWSFFEKPFLLADQLLDPTGAGVFWLTLGVIIGDIL